jgi:hypothetical protein
METKTLLEWAGEYAKKTGEALNVGTLRKRRAMCGVGRLVPPKTYLLTREEFLQVLRTPLPMCRAIIGVDKSFTGRSA